MKLARKLTLALLVGIWTVLGVHAFFELNREEAAFKEDLTDDLRTLGRALAPAVKRVWESEGHVPVLDVPDPEQARHKVSIRWVWLGGPGVDAYRPPLSAEQLTRLRGGDDVTLMDEDDRDGAGRAYVYVRVDLEDAPPGALELSESLGPQKEYLRTTLTRLGVTTGAMALVSGLIAIIIGLSLVGRPMRQLARRARAIGEGDWDTQLELPQEDEIGQLAHEMNAMSGRLGEAQGRIQSETQARISALEQLRHADRLMTVGKLASGIAHELGTPLNVVGGRARLIANGDVEGPDVVQSARVIMDQADRMTRIIRQLMDFARRREPQKTPHALGTLSGNAATMLRPIAEKKGVSLTVEVQPDLPDTRVDEGQLTQVLTNLMVNAIHATPAGGKLTVRVLARTATPPPDVGGPQAAYQVVEVADTGSGIAPEHLTRIFEPFFTTKGVGEGTGLGLSVAYGIVREHGGFITVDSRPQGGSTFSVHLPQG